MDKGPSHLRPHERASQWVLANESDNEVERSTKTEAKTLLLGLVPSDDLVDFFVGAVPKYDGKAHRSRSREVLTSTQGRSACGFRSASTRRLSTSTR